MIFSSKDFEKDYNFVLLFGNDILNEAGFEFNEKGNSDENRLVGYKFGTIRIRNKCETSNGTTERNHGLSIKVDFNKDLKDTPVPINRKTGDIIRKKNDALSKVKDSKQINYIQNFIYANLDDIVGYYDTDDENKLKYYKNNILNNSLGKSFKKRIDK